MSENELETKYLISMSYKHDATNNHKNIFFICIYIGV